MSRDLSPPVSQNQTVQPLAGVKVLDFSTLLPGPMAGLMLAEAGAEVVKIERPGGGEDMRHYEPKWGRDAAKDLAATKRAPALGAHNEELLDKRSR